jgi:hypothetical protein
MRVVKGVMFGARLEMMRRQADTRQVGTPVFICASIRPETTACATKSWR